jgi:hypothetical protein
MGSLGVIAAAGKAKRFNGILKELLPVGDGISLLERNIKLLYACDSILIVSTPEKMAAHAAVASKYSKVSLTPQRRDWDIYGAMYAGMWFPHDRIHFVMADTYMPMNVFKGDTGIAPVFLGFHKTDEPWRYGILNPSGRLEVVNKPSDLTGKHMAWGALGWSNEVTKELFYRSKLSYTQAINIMLKKFPVMLDKMEYYYDIGSWEHYWRFVHETGLSTKGNRSDRRVYPPV